MDRPDDPQLLALKKCRFLKEAYELQHDLLGKCASHSCAVYRPL